MSTKSPDYGELWASCTLDATRLPSIKRETDRIRKNKNTYDAIAGLANCAWWVPGLLHYRESSALTLDVYLHNGQKLGKKTTIVPKGIFFRTDQFIDAAVDALKREGLFGVKDPVIFLGKAERFNGLGYRRTGEYSPYVWAGTNHSDETGKYVADGRYSASAIEKQLGVAALLKGLLSWAPITQPKENTMQLRLGAVGDEVSALKKDLIILGYPLNDLGLNKGAFGPTTERYVREFQKANHLTPDGWAGPLTLIAIRRAVALKVGAEVVPSTAKYWKPGPYHPMFVVPEGCTHLHPYDVLYYVRGEREILGSRDNPLIAHFHEHSGNLGTHSEGADYHDEVPHCSSALNWAADGAGCYKSDNALASSWDGYAKKCGAKALKKGDTVPRGAIIRIAHPGGHVTLANREFVWTGKGSFEGFGSNQGNTIKTSTYSQAHIKTIHLWKPLSGTILAPISAKPVPSTGKGNESTR